MMAIEQIPVKKLVAGFSLPVYGLGTWQMGGRTEADKSNDAAEIQAIQNAIERGITHIDTAESYGAGHTEELVGEAVKGHDRSRLLIASKVSAGNQTYDGLLASCEASLKRLNTDYLDLYMLHRYPEKGIDIAKTMKAMDRLVAEGVVKNIGVCNMSINRFKEVQKHTKNQIVCNQVHYSLACREITDKGVLEFCQENNVAVVAWGPLQKGELEAAPILNTIAAKYNKSPYQIALNWLISQQSVVTIPKTTSLEHLEENLGAIGWELEMSDKLELTENFPGQYFVSDRVPLNYEADVEV